MSKWKKVIFGSLTGSDHMTGQGRTALSWEEALVQLVPLDICWM